MEKVEKPRNSKPLTLREVLFNQYQAILAAGALGFSILVGEGWPFWLYAGLNGLTIPFLVGNDRIGRLRWTRERAREIEEAAAEPEDVRKGEPLPPNAQKRFDELAAIARNVERNYQRLSEVSRPLLEEQKAKLQSILATGRSHLSALSVYEDLEREGMDAEELAKEIGDLEARVANASTPDGLRAKLRETLSFKRRLGETLARSSENRAALEAEFDSLETALRILAQESTALLAPSEVAKRLDELVSSSESTNETVRELEKLAEDGRDVRRLRAASLQRA